MRRADQTRATKEAAAKIIDDFPKVASLPRDSRGLPVPANVSRDPVSGKPVFAASDLNKEIDLLCDGRCAVTGTKLDAKDVWFISTPDLAFYPFGLFLDAPMCGQAKDFSLQVCPYFGVMGYQALSSAQKDAISRNRPGVDPVETFIQPAKFIAVCVQGFQVQPTRLGMRYLPSRKYTHVEFWKERSREEIVEGANIESLVAEYAERANGKIPKDAWPEWAHSSIKGDLNDIWPWEIPGARFALLQAAMKALSN